MTKSRILEKAFDIGGKKSDVESELPEGWSETKIKFVLENLQAGGTPSTTTEEYWTKGEDGTPWVKISDITGTEVVTDTSKKVTEKGVSEANLQIHPPGTLLFSMYASLGATATLGIPATTNQAILALYPDRDLCLSEYLQYYLQAIRPFLPALSMSNTQDNLSSEKFGNLPILLPPKDTQQQICEMFNSNLEPINSLISSSESLFELIEQRKRSLTDELISDCSDADDVKLKYVTNMLPGYAFSSDRFSMSAKGTPLLRGINIDAGETSWEDTVYWATDLDKYSDYLLEPGDIVLAMDRPWVSDGMRIAQLERDDCPALLVQRVLRIRTTEEVLQEYVRIALESVRFKQYFDPILTGVSVPHISKEQVGDFSIPVPPIKVQKLVVSEWKNFYSTRKELELMIEELIDVLEEKRQALITAAVTGQIDISKEKGVIQGDD